MLNFVVNWCNAGCFPVSVSSNGEASHPGPDSSNRLILETINVTTLNIPISRDLLLQRKAHAIFIQEHLTPQDKAPMTQAYFTKHTVFVLLTDPDSANPSAGVGLIAAQGIRCTNPVARTDKLAFFRQQGRADIYNLDMGSSTALMVINLYGWQGAATNGKSRKKTDELITAEQQEFDTTGIGPKIVLATSTRTLMTAVQR